MPENYEVIYRATAEFGDLMQKAAEAKAALRDLQQAAREEGSTEADAADKAAAAHLADAQAIKKQRDALAELAATAKAANKETAFGGRDSMQARLSDLDAQRQREDLLNRTKWGGYTNPQSWEAWQQQVWQHQIIRNKEAREGYASPDQYLNYLDQRRTRTQAETEAMKTRASAVQAEAAALLEHNSALRQTRESAGTLGTTGTQNIQGYQSALAGLPGEVSTRVRFADDAARKDLATYRQGLSGVPEKLTTAAYLDASQYLSELAKIKSAAGPAMLTPPAVSAAQQGLREFTAAHTYGPGVAGPAQMRPESAAALQESLRQAYPPAAPPQPARITSDAEMDALRAAYQARRAQGPPPSTAVPEEVLAELRARGAKLAPQFDPATGMFTPGQVAAEAAAPLAEHERIAAELRQRVESGAYGAGSRLPSRAQLAGEFGVTPPVVSRAVGMLVASGHAEARPGGTYAPSRGGDVVQPLVRIAGKDRALDDVKDIKGALTDLGRQVAEPRVAVGSFGFASDMRKIQEAMAGVRKGYESVGAQPAGYSGLTRQFAQVQAQAVRAFDDIENRGKRSASGVASRFQGLRSSIANVFHSMATSAADGAQGAEGAVASLADRISAAFRGVTKSGLSDVFKNLAMTAAAAGSQIVSSLTPMAAAFIAVIQLLPALVAGFGALATVFASMPELVAALSTVMVTLKQAIDPVVAALQAYAGVLAASESAAANPLQTAMQTAQMQNQLANAYYEVSQAAFQAMETQVQDAHAVADAQFNLQQATVNAANAQIVAAHAVKDAQFELAQANFSQSIQQVESAMSVAEAQHTLRDAVFETGQAQYQLDIAWQTAQEDLANLMIQVDYASVNLRGAQLALEEAQQNYAQTMANSNATALDRAQAAYQIQAAEEALAEQEQQNKDTETQLSDVRKFGASQVFGVTQAEHALTDAQFAQVQAQKQLMVTQKEAANAQVEAAHAVEDAVFALSQAYFNQRETAVTGAHDISEAQYQLSQSQIQQGEGFVTSAHDQKQAAFELQQAIDQMALGLPSVASAEEQLATAMYKLGPAGKQATLDLEPLAKWFVTNKSIGQAFFAQMLPSLGRIGTLLPPVSAYLGQAAGALGSLGNQALTYFERLANSPAWRVLTAGAVHIIDNLGDAVGHVVKGFTDLAVVAEPFTRWLTRGIDDLAKKFEHWAAVADKPGSDFRRWLNEIRPVLDDVGHVVKAIIDGFSIIAGGPMGSPGARASLREFRDLMHTLAFQILPNLFTLLHDLSSPQLASALIQLFGAMSQLLLTIVNTPGFQLGFQLFLHILIGVLDVLTAISRLGVVGNILGAIAGSLLALGAAMAAAKYSGLLTLITHFKTLTSWAQKAYGWMRKVFGFGGAGGGEGSVPGGEPADTGAGTFSETVTAAGEKFAETVTGAGEKVGADLEEGGAASGGEEAAGGSAAGAEGASGGLLGGILSKLGLSGGLIGPLGAGIIAGAIVRALGDKLAPKGSVAGNLSNVQQQQTSGIGGVGQVGLGGFEGWVMAHQGFDRYAADVESFFAQEIPKLGANFVSGISQDWDQVNNAWVSDVQDPVANFFTSTLPSWFEGLPGDAAAAWNTIWSFFSRDFISPLGGFFTGTVPNFFAGLLHDGETTWIDLWQAFDQHVIQPAGDFFTRTIAGWFTGWWKDFDNDVVKPMGSFLATALPKSIENGFKNALNWVITNVINRAIGFVNDVTHVVGIPSLKKVQTLARGGHVSVAGGGDEDSVPALLTPGEFIIRKPARMAIDAQMGPDFLRQLNSVQGYAAGGAVAPGSGGGPAATVNSATPSGSSSNPLTSLLGNIGGFLGSVGTGLEHLIGGGLQGIEKLLGQGANVLFSKVWSTAIQPIATKALGALGSGSSMAESLGYAVLGDIKKGISSLLTTFGIGSSGHIGPGGGSATPGLMTVARFMMGKGATASAAAGIAGTVAGESEGNPEAVGSGGAGLIGWTPPSSAAPYYPIVTGNPSHDMAVQLADMLYYIDHNGGIGPLNAAGLAGPLAAAWEFSSKYERPLVTGSDIRPDVVNQIYSILTGGKYTGGDVIAAAKEASPSVKIREAMLLGSRLATGWDPSYRRDGKRFGAWAIDKSIDKTVTEARAMDPYWAARRILPRYEHAVSHFGWSRLPQDPAAAAAQAEDVGSFYSKDGAGGVNLAWGDVLKALGIKSQVSTGPGGASGKPGGLDPVQQWLLGLSQMNAAVLAERHAYDVLQAGFPDYKRKSADGVKAGTADWGRWYAMDIILGDEKAKVLSDASSSYFTRLWDATSTPETMNSAMWGNFASGLTTLYDWTSGDKMPPRSTWIEEASVPWPRGYARLPKRDIMQKHGVQYIGEIQPSLSMIEKHQRSAWEKEKSALLDVSRITATTEKVWKELYGPGGSLLPHTVHGPPTPGPGTPPPSAYLAQPNYGEQIMNFVTAGGPRVPMFAGGGSVAGLGGMFGGFQAGGGVPDFSDFTPVLSQPGMSVAARGLSAGAQASGAGSSVGMQFNGGIHVSNPLPERASDSIAHQVNRLAFLHGRGVA